MLLEDTSRCEDASALVRERVTSFLQSRGYRLDGTSFRRGSLLGTFVGMSPKKWSVRVTVEDANPVGYQLRFDINTTGQLVTNAESRFWRDEFDATMSVLRGEKAPDLEIVESTAKAYNVRVALFMLLGALALVAVLVLFRYFLSLRGIRVPAGVEPIAIGLGVGIGVQQWRKMQARRNRGD